MRSQSRRLTLLVVAVAALALAAGACSSKSDSANTTGSGSGSGSGGCTASAGAGTTVAGSGGSVTTSAAAAPTTAASGSSGTASAAPVNIDYASLSGTLNGSGSTFQKAFDEDGDRRLRRRPAPNLTVNYAGGGSGKGKQDLADQVVDCAGTRQHRQGRGPVEVQGRGHPLLPDGGRADHRVVQPRGRRQAAAQRADTLAKIFSRTITTWNDPAIAADNPGVTLPSTPIVVVHRSDGSGTTSNFTKYLKAARRLGLDPRLPVTPSTGRPTPRPATATPAWPRPSTSTDGAIGYVDFSDANAPAT